MACIEALEWTHHNCPWDGVTCVLIVTDSQYVAQGVRLARQWKTNDWRNRNGGPILNTDLWKDLLRSISKARTKTRIRVEFIWQAGKTNDIGKRVDKLAKAAAKRGGIDRDTGYSPGSVSRPIAQEGVARIYPASGQTAVIRPYTKRRVRKDEERISFEVLDERTQTCGSKFYAFTTSDIAYDLHRWHWYRVQFNDNPNYPQILNCIEEVGSRTVI